MSNTTNPQRRNTYLISLTLVKVEALPEDEAEGEIQERETGPGKEEEVSPANEKDKIPACEKVLDAEENELEAVQEVQSDYGSPPRTRVRPGTRETQDYGSPPRTRGRPEMRETQERTLINLHPKEVSHMPPHINDPVRAHAGFFLEGGVRREGTRPEGLRPKTEFYREPPRLFLKREEGGDLNSNRSRCSLPIPVSPQAGQCPEVLMRSHAGGWEIREANPRMHPSVKTLDRRDNRFGDQSPRMATATLGPHRASWADSDSKGTLIRPGLAVGGGFSGMLLRECPQGDGFKTLQEPPPAVGFMPRRKGKSRTLDNSDLNSLSEDLKKGKEGQGGTIQRAPARDRKMLKFISGIFTKSTTVQSATNTASLLYPPVERCSSEEEATCPISQEWTFNQTVQQLHLGVLGGLHSGKSALIHRHITGSYLPVENPEGRQYIKEVLVDGQSHLLVIREETGPPDAQFANWVDAVILVFSLENEASFQEVYRNYNQLSAHRPITEIPFIVVGTQDKISSSNPRVINDGQARQLCSDVRRCTYYETCATYGLNVNRVFTDAAQKILAAKKQAVLLASCKSLPNSPSHSGGSTPVSGVFPGQASNGGQSSDYSSSLPSTPVINHKELGRTSRGERDDGSTPGAVRSAPRRRTSRFTGRRGSDSNRRSADSVGDLGSGRSIPIKQGFLLKRSGNSLNKEWKKKYVTLSNDGILSYHPSVNDYMLNIPGKEIDLLRVTVKVPGKRPPRAVGVNGRAKDLHGPDGANPVPVVPNSLLQVEDFGGLGGSLFLSTSNAVLRCPSSLSSNRQGVDSAFEGVSSSSSTRDMAAASPPSDRKKQRRKKSMNQKGDMATGQSDAKRKMWKLKSFGSLRNVNKTDEDNFDFLVVSSTGQTWHFEAQSLEERDSWVQAIESQILASLQLCESSKNKIRKNSESEAVALQAIRNARGNNFCVDCDAPNPTWASLNLGALICIECSGIHRNLGTHLSRVRSLDLDDLPPELTLVLSAIGNHLANSIWEGRTLGHHKPTPDASREERESWIRAKYEQRLFVAPLPPPSPSKGPGITLSGRLILAAMERNLPKLLLLLAHCTKEDINAPPVSLALTSSSLLPPRLPASALHAACQQADVVMTQLIIWYGCDVRCRDAQGQTALVLARNAGSQECVDILLQHGCPNEPATSLAKTASISLAATPSLSVAMTPSLSVATTLKISHKSNVTNFSHCSSRRAIL